MSLRLRFFLISWPIVIVSVLLVAINLERWVTVELEERGPTDAPPVPVEIIDGWRDSVAAAFSEGNREAMRGLLPRLAQRAPTPVALLALDSAGRAVAMSDSLIHLVSGAQAAGGEITVERDALVPDGGREVQRATITGERVQDAAGRSLGGLYVLPLLADLASPPDGALRTDLRRTIWLTVLVASIASAIASLLLAGPLVRQVRRLTAAASAIRSGSLDTRVAVSSSGELSQLEQSFNAMAGSLEQAEHHKRNLVIDVAHELRTPLTNLLGSIEAMQDGLRAPDERTLASMHEEAQLLTGLVDELQELSLAESGQLAYSAERVDLVALASAAVEAMRYSAPEVTLFGPTDSLPVHARADARRVGQILRNLLRNATTHTPAGGTVRVELEQHAEQVTLRVIDSGRGIPAEHLPLIWERFHRVDPSRDRASGGMGLGLALVRQLAEGMGGRVAVESTPEAGSAFTVTLPAD